jgi:hypothetical protein
MSNNETDTAMSIEDEIRAVINGSNSVRYGMMVEQRTTVDMTLSCVNAW